MCYRRLDARTIRFVEKLRQTRRQRVDPRREMGDGRTHVLAEPARAQKPRRAAVDQSRGVDQHGRLHRVVDLVVERLDLLPKRDEAEDLAIEQISADNLVRFATGRLQQPMNEGAADAIDHAVGHVRSDDLALEWVARHVCRVALA